METISRRQSFSEKGINVMSEKEKIIVFSSREICYQSSSFFANQMADAFEDLGFDVQVCEFDEHDDLDAVFQPLYGQKYRLLLDFNSTITRMVEEDGTPVLDKIDGPFFDYILDHPRVKQTLTMPLGAAEAVTGGEKRETEEILFMGTYDDPDSIYEMVSLSPEPLKTYMKELIDRRVENPVLPMEEGFLQLLKAHGEELPDDQFALFMNAMYPVDAFIRDYFRKAAVDELLRAKIPMRLVGEGWEKYDHAENPFVKREKPVVFGLSFEKIAHADVMLNVSPFFNHGAHDRIFAGMANHCVVLTDKNPYLDRILKDREHVLMYSLKDIHTLSDYAEELLTNRPLCREIQNNAYTEFKHKYTWEEKAKQLLACTLR